MRWLASESDGCRKTRAERELTSDEWRRGSERRDSDVVAVCCCWLWVREERSGRDGQYQSRMDAQRQESRRKLPVAEGDVVVSYKSKVGEDEKVGVGRKEDATGQFTMIRFALTPMSLMTSLSTAFPLVILAQGRELHHSSCIA